MYIGDDRRSVPCVGHDSQVPLLVLTGPKRDDTAAVLLLGTIHLQQTCIHLEEQPIRRLLHSAAVCATTVPNSDRLHEWRIRWCSRATSAKVAETE